MTVLILILLVPSVYFAFKLYEERKFNEKINNFIENEFTNKGYTIIYKKTRYVSNPHSVEVALLSKKISTEELAELNDKLKFYKIANTKLQIRQDTTNLKQDIMNEIGIEKATLNEKDILIEKLKKEIASSKIDNQQLFSEVKILFPEIRNISVAKHTFNEGTDSLKTIPVMVYQVKKSLSLPAKVKLLSWLKQKLKADNLEIYEEQTTIVNKIKRK